ncbi:12097_t:CDS:2, partial [Gigaspora margarita]
MQFTQRVESINAIIHKSVDSSSSRSDVVKALELFSSTIQKYFTSQIIEEIHKQICESVLYKCEKLDISHTFEFEDQDSNNYNELNNGQIEIIESIKDYYDIQQTYLKALINLVSKESIKE